jgi:polysaccharide export outer membrane protein
MLAEYIHNPKMAINIAKYHTTRVYVLGEVKKPGMYEIDKQHNLLDAIGKAEGYTDKAAKKKVFIIRRGETEPQYVNLLNMLTKGNMEQNYSLNDGDVVYLSDNGKINFGTDIVPWITAMYQVRHF